jgi:hypothetical protein
VVSKQDPSELTQGSVKRAITDALDLEWDLSGRPDVRGYLILGDGTEDRPDGLFAAVDKADINTYTDLGLLEDTGYRYTVWEVTSAKGGNPTRQLTSPFKGRTEPKINNGRATPLSQTQILLEWAPSLDTETVSFEIRRSGLISGFYNPIANVSPTLTGYTDTGLRIDTVYFYDIYEKNALGSSREFERDFSAKTMGLDVHEDNQIDVQDLMWIIGSARRGENNYRPFFEMCLPWGKPSNWPPR